MRVLAIPYLDKKILMKSSCFRGMVNCIRGILDRYEDIEFDLVVPKKDKSIEWEYDKEEIINGRDRFNIIEVPTYCLERDSKPFFLTEHMMVMPEMFDLVNPLRNGWKYDLIWNAQNWMSITYKRYMQHGWKSSDLSIPILTFVPDVALNSKKGIYTIKNDGAFQIGDTLSLLFDYGQVIQPNELYEVKGQARKYLSPAFVNKLTEDTSIIPLPFENDKILSLKEKYDEYRKSKKDKIVVFAGRFEARKNIDSVLKVLERIKKLGIAEPMVISPENYIPDKVKNVVDEDKIFINQNFENYLDKLKFADVYVSMENAVTAYIPFEMAFSGLIPVYLKRDWLRDLLGDYPFVANNLEEVVKMVKIIFDDIDYARNKADEFIELLTDWGSVDNISSKLYSLFENIVTEDNSRRIYTRGSMFDLIKLACDKRKIDYDYIYSNLKDKSDGGIDFRDRQDILPKRQIRKTILSLGYKECYKQLEFYL